VFSPAAFPGRTNYTGVGNDGSWSFSTDEFGPFDLAFYTTATGDCSQPIQSTPVPSWYTNQPLAGTDEHTITPPVGASAVTAGASGVLACLGATALPTSACVVPDGVLSGTVFTTGPIPLADVCVIALDGNSDGVAAVTDIAGHWSITGLPRTSFVVVFLPDASDPNSPCAGGNNGPPTVPGPGQLQPVFYADTWANLADPTLLNDAYHWALTQGAALLTADAPAISTCITTAAGNIIPRPGCTPSTQVPASPTAAAAAADPLAQTGSPTTGLLTTGTTLTLLGLTLCLAARRRERHNA
jgi:hypothetical protein